MTQLILSRVVKCIAFLVFCSVSTAVAQTLPPPPVDPSEGAGAGEPVRIGPVTLSGSAWLESIFVTGDDPTRPMDTFRIRRGRIGLAGNVAPKIGWSIAGEFTSSPALRVAFLLFRLSPHLNIRVGQATPPNGLERATNPLMSELIERSRLTTQFTHGLDIGVTVLNEQPLKGWLSYALSVVNGSGFNQSDNNRGKDVVGRLRITPPSIEGLTVLASGATGEQPQGTRKRATLGAQYDVPSFKIGLDGVRQTVDENPASEGFVVFGALRFRPETPTPHFRMLEFGARYFMMNDRSILPPPPDEDGGVPAAGNGLPTTTREVHVGVNYDVNRNVRLMSNVLVPVDDRPSATTFLTRLQLVF